MPDHPSKDTWDYDAGNTVDVYSSFAESYWVIVEHQLPEGSTMAGVADIYARSNEEAKQVKLVEGYSIEIDGQPGYVARYESVIDDIVHTNEFSVVQDGREMLLVETLSAGRGYGGNELRIAITATADVHLVGAAEGSGRT